MPELLSYGDKVQAIPFLKAKGLDPDLVDRIAIDPSVPEQAFEWVVSQYAEGLLFYPEDNPRVMEVYDWWTEAKKRSDVQKAFKEVYPDRNIKNPLEFAVWQIEDIKYQFEREERLAQIRASRGSSFKPEIKEFATIKYEGEDLTIDLRNGASTVYDEDDGVIVKVEDQLASCFYGDSTSWCTRHPGTASNYLEQSPLYVIYNSDADKIAQVWFRGKTLESISDSYDLQIMDLRDRKISLSELPEGVQQYLYRELFQSIIDADVFGRGVELADDRLWHKLSMKEKITDPFDATNDALSALRTISIDNDHLQGALKTMESIESELAIQQVNMMLESVKEKPDMFKSEEAVSRLDIIIKEVAGMMTDTDLKGDLVYGDPEDNTILNNMLDLFAREGHLMKVPKDLRFDMLSKYETKIEMKELWGVANILNTIANDFEVSPILDPTPSVSGKGRYSRYQRRQYELIVPEFLNMWVDTIPDASTNQEEMGRWYNLTAHLSRNLFWDMAHEAAIDKSEESSSRLMEIMSVYIPENTYTYTPIDDLITKVVGSETTSRVASESESLAQRIPEHKPRTVLMQGYFDYRKDNPYTDEVQFIQEGVYNSQSVLSWGDGEYSKSPAAVAVPAPSMTKIGVDGIASMSSMFNDPHMPALLKWTNGDLLVESLDRLTGGKSRIPLSAAYTIDADQKRGTGSFKGTHKSAVSEPIRKPVDLRYVRISSAERSGDHWTDGYGTLSSVLTASIPNSMFEMNYDPNKLSDIKGHDSTWSGRATGVVDYVYDPTANPNLRANFTMNQKEKIWDSLLGPIIDTKMHFHYIPELNMENLPSA